MKALAPLLLAVLVVGACGARHVKTGKRVIVLGIDGMDHQLVTDLMARGRLPHFAQLVRSGGRFSALATSTPPQSPVAWSTFITGTDPGAHAIFDFIHRDPKTMEAFLSTSKTVAPSRLLKLGRWQFPLDSGHVDLLVRGEPFWSVLERRGVQTTIMRMPADFPPSGTASRELSGMGTPDLLGTYGTFSFVTSRPLAEARAVSGANVIPATVTDGVVRGSLDGPENPYYTDPQKTRIDFAAYVDETGQYVKLAIGDEERLLKVGEWSDWIPVRFKLLPFQHLAAECRVFVKQLNPYFEMYISPFNMDPFEPALPISAPHGFAADLARRTGRFYTQGMPEETKGLKSGLLSPDDFLSQTRITAGENFAEYWSIFDSVDDGLLFYYFGHTDQVSHMMWRAMDPDHPGYTSEDAPYRHIVEDLYVQMDDLVGRTLARLGPNDLLVVMSDHGFTSWRRSFSLNAWLRENGYLAVRDPSLTNDPGLFTNIDWSRTRAYALGLNGLYINVRGREAHGIVDPSARESLVREIAGRLERTIDPKTGLPAVSRAFPREAVYHLHGDEDLAPDIIVGYTKGTRSSDESSLGAVPRDVFADNLDPWGADHCMDPAAVPGILLTSRPLKQDTPSLQTLASAIVAEFGVKDFPR